MRHSGRDSIKKNALLVCLLAVVLIAYATYGASVKPDAVTFGQNTSANYAKSNFSVNWTANTTGDNISNFSVYIFNSGSFVLKAANTSANGYFFNASINNGNYTFNISAVNATGDESENLTSSWIFVDLQNATIALNSPANGLNTSNASVSFNFTAIDNTALNCSLYINGIINQTNASIANNTATLFSTTLAEGRHMWNISCTDLAKNTNTSATYNLGIDMSAPSIALIFPSAGSLDYDGKTNFTFSATDALTAIANCSLWINAAANTTGTWHEDLVNTSVLNGSVSTFAYDNGTNVLGNGTYLWNVRCYDTVSNSNFSSQNYTFTVGNATDFTVTNVRLINSSNGNNPIPGSNLTINATIANIGTLNSSADITVTLFFETTFIANHTISNNTLLSNSSTNITFNISGGNITGFGSHNIKISVDYMDLIPEQNETNNNMTLVLLSGLNVSANTTLGSAVQTPKPGENVSINLTVKYQNNSAVAGLIQANFTIYDVYTYDNGTVLTSRTLVINNINGSQNESGIYYINATSPVKTAANRAEYGNHTIRVYVKDNKSVAYYGEDNRTSNYYTMQAPNLVINFSASSYDIDLINGVSSKSINIMMKNTGTINISDINLSIFTNSDDLTLLYNSTYGRTMPCNYTNVISANASSSFITVPACDIRYNTTKNGTYTITARASGRGIDTTIYNATEISQTISVVNSSNTGSTASSSTSSGTAITLPVKKYNYTIDILNYAKTVLIEQGNKSNITFAIKNKGNGTIHNLSVKLTTPTTVSWGMWYNSTKLYLFYPGQTAHIGINLSVPSNATVATYTITANVSGEEAGSSKIVTFLVQVLPGNDTKKQITVSLAGILAQITELNDAISKLIKNTNTDNLTLASKKLSEVIRLKLEAENAIIVGDYLTAYNNKRDIEAMLPEIRALLVTEKQAVEKKQNMQKNILIVMAFVLAIAGAFCYLWLPEEGYVPGRGYFKKNSISHITRLKDNLYVMMHKSARNPINVVKEMMDKDKQNTQLLKTKEQPYNYSPKNAGSVFSLKKMSRNLMDQFKEHKQANEKPNYNFHKKQRWSDD